MIHTIQNRHLAVQVDDLGAQLCSVRSPDGTEYIWQADPAIWGRHAPLLFPVIGRLQDGQYTLDGQVFSIPIHGFARDSLFQVVNAPCSPKNLAKTGTKYEKREPFLLRKSSLGSHLVATKYFTFFAPLAPQRFPAFFGSLLVAMPQKGTKRPPSMTGA